MRARMSTLSGLLKAAQRHAADADTFNSTTLGELTRLLENPKPNWGDLVNYIRKRTEKCAARFELVPRNGCIFSHVLRPSLPWMPP